MFDERIVANSAAEARRTAVENAAKRACSSCDTVAPLHIFQIWGTEEISLHPEYTIYGYTCKCGEKVEVARVEIETSLNPPTSKTVSCSNGHSRTILNHEFPFLQVWQEKTN